MTLPPPSDRPQHWTQGLPAQQFPQQTGGPAPSWGHQPPPQAPPVAPQTSPWRTGLIGLVAGIVVSALVVGGLTLAGIVHFGSDSSVADTRSVDLSESLGGLTDVQTAATAKNPQGGAAAGERYGRTYIRTAELYRTAFDGAGVGVRAYTNADLDYFLTVIAVRADTPGLLQGGPQADPADLGVVAQPNSANLVTDGDVQCLQTVTRVVKEGETVDPDDVLTTVCRTAAEGLTVYVFGGGGTTGVQGKQLMVDLTRAARSTIAGS